MKKKLNSKERIFVDEYLLHLNPERAAIAAGYSRSMARTKAYQWVSDGKRKPHVFSAIKAALDKRSKRTEIKQDLVLRELAKIAFLDPREFFDSKGRLRELASLPEDVAGAVAGFDAIEVPAKKKGAKTVTLKKIKFADKLKALDSLARHLGMFVDRVQHGLDQQALGIILSSLPPEYSERVRRALAAKLGQR